MTETYRAFVVHKDDDATRLAYEERPAPEPQDGEVVVRIAWSCVNYKDGLATLPKGGVVRAWPRVPGVDMAGVVAASRDQRFREGDEVVCTGYDFGVNHDGGYAEQCCVPGDWLFRRPDGLSLRDCMTFGTAGFTAALAIQQMERNGLVPGNGEVLVTGASGGVGSMAVAMLANLGHRVAAATGKSDAAAFLTGLGAESILSREAVSEEPRPIGRARWAGAVDQVGGRVLAWTLSTMAYRGVCAATGLTGGPGLQSTVFPFILRGVSLLGIDSVMCPMAERVPLWARMAGELRPADLNSMTTEVAFDDLQATLTTILKGGVTGRTVVRLAGG